LLIAVGLGFPSFFCEVDELTNRWLAFDTQTRNVIFRNPDIVAGDTQPFINQKDELVLPLTDS
jgi:hypothetical protein